MVSRRLIVLAAAVPACLAASAREPSPPAAPDRRAATVEWEASTLTLIREGAGYGRIRRIAGRRLIAVYDLGGEIHISHSRDGGRAWLNGVRAASIPYGHVTNPDLLVTKRGRALLFFNERPTDGLHLFAISMSRSDDGGRTWSERRVLSEADARFENGCWEPAAVEMPDGEIRLVFANESPYRSSAEQEISMMSSRDEGTTWTQPCPVSFRPGGRDGMPVPALIGRRRRMHIAIEDSGLSGLMKPVIIRVGKDLPVRPGSADRWPALRRQRAPEVNVAAPYLVQMPTGETVLSCQSTEGARRARLVVFVGDADARNFDGASEPFAIPRDVEGLWNSLFVKGRDTVTAVSSTKLRGRGGLWAVDGRVRASAELGGAARP